MAAICATVRFFCQQNYCTLKNTTKCNFLESCNFDAVRAYDTRQWILWVIQMLFEYLIAIVAQTITLEDLLENLKNENIEIF